MKFVRYFVVLSLLFCCWQAGAGENKAAADYNKVAACFHQLKGAANPTRAKWFSCASQLKSFAKKNAGSEYAPKALFSAGLAFRNIYSITENSSDAEDAITEFNDLVRSYPKSSLSDDAIFNIATLENEALKDKKLAERDLLRLLKWYPDGDMAPEAKAYMKKMGGEIPDKEDLRPTKKENIERVTKIERETDKDVDKFKLYLTGPVAFTEKQTPHTEPKLELYKLSLKNAKLPRTFDSGYSYVGKSVVRDVTIDQVSRELGELNIVIRKDNHCSAFKTGKQIEVICSKGLVEKKVKEAPPAATPPTPKMKTKTAEVVPPVKAPTADESKAEGTAPKSKKIVIVIDAGHGGHDRGAIGPDGVKEKDVVLQISKRLGWQLRNKLNADVNYTRLDDKFISLDDRNKIAKDLKADLFISIHANAAENKQLTGYQTFYLNNASDDASRKLAAQENATMGKNMDDLEKIILTMMQNVNTEESSMLAKSVHKNVLSRMSKYGLRDRKVKSALFYVLVGARCPAILVETSFISNADEEKKLTNADYQEEMAKAIAEGVKQYFGKSSML